METQPGLRVLLVGKAPDGVAGLAVPLQHAGYAVDLVAEGSAALQAVEFVGLPECQLNLSQAVTYLATAPKSNAATVAIGKARDDVKSGRTLEVPKHLRDAHYKGAKKFGHGTDYKYAHNYDDGWVNQAYLPEDRRYYEPTDRGYEAEIGKRLELLRQRRQQSIIDASQKRSAEDH